MSSGLWPRVRLLHGQDASPQIPHKWSVSERLTLEPSATAGLSRSPFIDTQSAVLFSTSLFDPLGNGTVMPMGCCLGLVASWPRITSIMWYCQATASGDPSVSLAIS